MATARHGGRGEFVLRRQHSESAGRGGPFELIDRPLRLAAGDDAVLLRILRGALCGGFAAAIGAITYGAVF